MAHHGVSICSPNNALQAGDLSLSDVVHLDVLQSLADRGSDHRASAKNVVAPVSPFGFAI